MQRSKSLIKKCVTELVVSKEVNFRDDYDLPSMCDQIVNKGRIIEPVFIEKGSNIVLRGNRRIAAGQLLFSDKNCSEELKRALSAVECYECVLENERERVEFVLDHGGQKPLSRVEIVKAVRRLLRQMLSEKEIASLLFQQLSRFTGKSQKAWEASQIPSGPTRDEFVRKWLHGTLGNYIIPASSMGDEVWQQFLLSELGNDRTLSKEEEGQRTFDANREAIKRLNSAKAKDKEQKGWDPIKGGQLFNEELAKLKEEFNKPRVRADKFTPEQMVTAAENMQSGIRLAYMACAGKINGADKAELDRLDTEYARRDKIFPAIHAVIEKITDERVKTLLDAILTKSDKEVSEALAPFLPNS